MINLVELRGISKVYENGIYANQSVDFSLLPGEIHALIGENGAGKSTLMKILYGMEKPDSGEIIIRGKAASFSSPTDAMRHEIGMVHQHFMLVESLTVLENVALGFEISRLGLVDRAATRKKVLQTMEMFGLALNPDSKVSELSVASKQKIEIIKALYRGASILILDEPTAVLTPQETADLFAKLKELKESGLTIVFISHKLREVMELCDRCSIMRRGVMVATVHVKDVTRQEISKMMIDSSFSERIPKGEARFGEVRLRVSSLSCMGKGGKPLLDQVSLAVRSGEVLGIAGVEGNGQGELVEAIFGLRPCQGDIQVLGRQAAGMSIRQMRDAGVSHVPADRMSTGLASTMTVEDNLVATRLKRPDFYRARLLSKARTAPFAKALIADFQIRCSSHRDEVAMLSGGNMQKVVAAREFGADTRLFIVEQPSRGIDVGSASLIHEKLIQMRSAGCAILLVSADLEELLKLSDSIAVMYEGKISAYFPDASQTNETELGFYMLGVRQQTSQEIGRACHA